MPPRPVFLLIFLLAPMLVSGDEQESALVDQLFQDYSVGKRPGCALGVLRGQTVLLQKGYGTADLEHSLPITPQSVFYMASVSKQFTSLAMLLAEQQGKLKLTDSVRRHIPELPAYADGITIHRMLDHTAGFRDVLALWGLRGWTTESVLQEPASLDLIVRQRALNFQPGDEYSYSNSGYLLAAIALHRATGQRLGEFADANIFRPLGMAATRFQHDHGLPVENRASGYVNRDGGWRTANLGFDLAGSGGMYSNVSDMLKWAQNFDQPRAGKELLDRLVTPSKMNNGREPNGGYALGLARATREGVTIHSHAGGTVGYSTFFLRIPERKLSVICLCNFGGAPVSEHAHRVAEIYTGLKLAVAGAAKPETPQLVAQGAPAPPGTYWSEELETIWRIVNTSGSHAVRYDGGELPIRRHPDGSFRAGPYTLKPASDGGFTVDAGRAQGIGFARK